MQRAHETLSYSYIPMLDVDLVAVLSEQLRNHKGERNRTMPPAGTPESYCEITLSLTPVTGQQIFKKGKKSGQKLRRTYTRR
jgi:hypothetical protein